MSNLIMSLFVVIVAIVAVLTLLKFNSSSKWLAASGQIDTASFKSIGGSSLLRDSSNRGTDKKISIQYSYKVHGITYHGDTVTAGFPNIVSDQVEAEKLIERFPAGGSAEVFYNPDNLEQSALITSKGVPIMGIVVIFLFIISIGSGMIWLINSDFMS